MKRIIKYTLVVICLFSVIVISSGARNLEEKNVESKVLRPTAELIEKCQEAGASFSGDIVKVIQEEDGKEYLIKGDDLAIDSTENGLLKISVSKNVLMAGNSMTLAAKQVSFVLKNGQATDVELTEAYVAE